MLLLLADVVSHKGMLRSMLPKKFPTSSLTVAAPLLSNNLENTHKDWIKAVDALNVLEGLPVTVNGIEVDIYYAASINTFEVHHDPVPTTHLLLETLLQDYQRLGLKATIWLDFKNLASSNSQSALLEITRLRKIFKLDNKIIIESPSADLLQVFSKANFFTSYYTPFFNPYLVKDDDLLHFADSMTVVLKQYPVNALSGYYYQYPFLKKYFPGFPILTWADNTSYSLVGYFFNRKLNNDSMLKIILRPLK